MLPTARVIFGGRPIPHRALGPPEVRILQAVGRYHYLTAEQIRRLYYGRSLSHVQELLKALADAGYLARRIQRRHGGKGSQPTIYALDRKGWQFLRDALGWDVAVRLRKSEAPGDYLFYAHVLAINDALIAAELVTRVVPEVVLESMRHDLELKRTPVRIQLRDTSTVNLVPDAWLTFLVEMADGRFRVPIALEVDRGTEGRMRWQAKLRAYLAGFGEGRGPILAAFGVSTFTVAVTTPTPERRRELLIWTEAFLRAEHREAAAALFRFSEADPIIAGPARFYTAPLWWRPFDPTGLPLLAVRQPIRPQLDDTPRLIVDRSQATERATIDGSPAFIPAHYLSQEQMADFLMATDDDRSSLVHGRFLDEAA